MWHELPMSFSEGFAMNVAEMPCRNAISFTPFLKIVWRSAEVTASA